MLLRNKGTKGSDPFVPFYLRANINKLIVITKFLAKKVNVISEMCQLKDILISFCVSEYHKVSRGSLQYMTYSTTRDAATRWWYEYGKEMADV